MTEEDKICIEEIRQMLDSETSISEIALFVETQNPQEKNYILRTLLGLKVNREEACELLRRLLTLF